MLKKASYVFAAAIISNFGAQAAFAYDMSMLKGTYSQLSDIGVPYVKKLVLSQGANGRVQASATLCHVPNEVNVNATGDAYIQRDVKLMGDKRTGERLILTFTTPNFSNLVEIDTGRRKVGEEPDWATVNLRNFLRYADGHCEYFDQVLDRME